MKKKASFFPAIVAVVITAASVWYVQRPAVPKQTTWDDVQVEARAGGYRIITTEDLADLYHKAPSGLLIVDTRQPWEYRTGHIDGAVNFPMEPTRWERWRKVSGLKNFLGPDKNRTLVFY